MPQSPAPHWLLSAFADEAGPSADEQIAALRRAGLRHIDLRSVDGHNIAALPIPLARNLRDKLDAAGIAVNMFGSPIGKIDLADPITSDLDKLRHLAELAPLLNCRSVRIFSYYSKKATPPLPHGEFQKQSLSRLHELKTLAQQLGLILYHENESHIFGDRAADVLTIAKHLRDPAGTSHAAFRTIFDFGNFNAAREDVWQNWLLLRDYTDAIHFKDNLWSDPQSAGRAKESELIHVPSGQGAGRVPEILADLAARHFAGPFTIEPHLTLSAAVVATGPSGVANQSYAAMSPADSFHLACTTVLDLFRKVPATPA